MEVLTMTQTAQVFFKVFFPKNSTINLDIPTCELPLANKFLDKDFLLFKEKISSFLDSHNLPQNFILDHMVFAPNETGMALSIATIAPEKHISIPELINDINKFFSALKTEFL